MKPFIRKKLPLILIAVQALLIAGLLIYIVPGRYQLYDIVLYDASEYVPANPLTGYAPDALKPDDCANTDLVFVTVSFADWEPQQGKFDTEGITEKYDLDEYRRAGKHAVIRFVCDIPGEDAHADIPDWLMEQTGDGYAYKDAAGRGYAPDYANKRFVQAHREALQALADWCRQDAFVAYVEAGSLGMNGEWGHDAEGAAVPSAETRQLYAEQYEEAFPEKDRIRLLFSSGAGPVEGRGSWGDMLGDGQAVANWNSALGNASSAPAGDGADALGNTAGGADADSSNAAMKPDAGKRNDHEAGELWMTSPVAGALTGTVPVDTLLMENLSDTLDQIRSSHVSFIGPVCPDADQQLTNGSEMILRNVGYCIYLSRLQTTVDFIDDDLQLHMTFGNIGQAPMYWDWPVSMYIYDRTGTCIRVQTLDLKLSDLLPGQTVTVTGTVPYSRSLLEGYTVGLAIRSPEGETVTLAQKGVLPDADGIHRIYRSKKIR